MRFDDFVYKIVAVATLITIAACIFGMIGAAWRFWVWLFA